MANRIAGITIKLDADSKPLTKALSGVNKNIANTQKSLKDVNKLLKLNPSNVTLLTQKQGYLTSAIEETKKKLDTEKEALAQLKANSTTGEVTEEQRALEREIIATQGELDNLTEDYKKFGSVGAQQMQAVGGKIQAVGGAMTEAGKTLTTHVTAPILAVGAASMAAFSEVDEAMDTLVKKTGASGDALDDLEASVKEIATSMPIDFQTAADAVGEVNTRFGLTGEELTKLSEKFIKFAELNNVDVNSAIDSTQKALEAFGMKSEEAGDLLDTLNGVAQASGIDVGKLTEALIKNAPEFEAMGLNAHQAAILLGEIEKSGMPTETALKGLQTAMQKAAKEGKPLDEALSAAEDAIRNAGTETEATQIAMQTFGSKAGPAIAQAIREGKLSFEDLEKYLGEYAGSVEKTYDATLDPIDNLKTAMNEAKLLGADIVESAAPMITMALEKVRDIVHGLTEKWNGLSDKQKSMIIKFGLVAAAAGPVLAALGGLVSGGGLVITKFGALVGAITAAGGIVPALGAFVTAAAPIMIGGAVVAGLVAGGILIYKNWGTIKTKAGEVAETIKTKWDDIKAKTTEAFDAIKDKVGTVAESIKTAVTTAWQAITITTTSVFNGIKAAVGAAIDATYGKVKIVFTNIKNAIEKPIEAAKKFVSDAVDAIKGFFDFEWSLPELKLPHIVVDRYVDIPVIGKIPDPTGIRVEWYKKAYNNPLMFTSPTVLQTPNGLKGFGDGNGGEIVLSDKKLREIAGSGTTNYTVNVYGAEGQNVNALADAVQRRLVALERQREAAGLV